MCQIVVPVPDNRPDINRVLIVAGPSTSDDIFVFPASAPQRRDVVCVWKIFFFPLLCVRCLVGYILVTWLQLIGVVGSLHCCLLMCVLSICR